MAQGAIQVTAVRLEKHLIRSPPHFRLLQAATQIYHQSRYTKRFIHFTTSIVLMPTSERITVSILDGATQAKFDEHQIVTTATKTECWIESKEDLQFSIKLDLAPASLETRNGFSCRIIVDGILVRQPLLSAWGGASWAERIVTGAWHNEKTRPLMFAKTLFKGTILSTSF